MEGFWIPCNFPVTSQACSIRLLRRSDCSDTRECSEALANSGPATLVGMMQDVRAAAETSPGVTIIVQSPANISTPLPEMETVESASGSSQQRVHPRSSANEERERNYSNRCL